ncbi:hypothetical protein OH492_06495 [Vibrio chagasii]|nr:hypothetical protein [Vibrio chagasii]
MQADEKTCPYQYQTGMAYRNTATHKTSRSSVSGVAGAALAKTLSRRGKNITTLYCEHPQAAGNASGGNKVRIYRY